MTDTFSFGSTREVSHGGEQRAVSHPSTGSRWSSWCGAGVACVRWRASSSRRSRRSATGSGRRILDEGRRSDGLTTEARLELLRLKRENKRLRMERDILKKAAAGSRGRADRSPAGIRIHEGAPGRVSTHRHVPGSGSLHQRVLRLEEASALGAGAARRGASEQDRSGVARQPRDLRPPADPRGAAGPGRAGGPEAGGAADGAGGHPGRESEALDDGHDPQGCEGSARGRPGEPGLLRRGSEPAVGCRHHVRAHLGGLGSTSPWCWMPGAVASWAGRWRRTCGPNWSRTRWRWRSRAASPGVG